MGQTSSLFRDRKGGTVNQEELGTKRQGTWALNARGNEATVDVDGGQPPRETQGPRAVSMTVSPGVTPRPALPATARFHARGTAPAAPQRTPGNFPGVSWWDRGSSPRR